MALSDVFNTGDINKIAAAARDVGLGNLLAAEGGIRLVRETLAIPGTAAATPNFNCFQLLYARTIATGAPAVKAAQINGAAPAVGQAAANTAGTSIVFNAETTGAGTCDVVYLTADPTKVAGVAKQPLSGSTGLF